MHRIVAGTPEDMAGTIFGAILVLAVIASGSGRGVEVWSLVELVVGTTLVFWLGHVYAHALGESVKLRRRIDWGEFATVARRQGAIPLAAVAPVVALCLGALGVLSERHAVWLALGLGVATLGVQGLRYARLEHLGRAGTVVAVGVNLVIGLAIVALKATITH